MKLTAKRTLVIGTVAFLAVPALAQSRGQDQQTPRGWSYEIKDGKRVPKANRVTSSDGGWREELKQGNCVTIKERSASGEYKETRQCNPGNPQ